MNFDKLNMLDIWLVFVAIIALILGLLGFISIGVDTHKTRNQN